MDCLIKACNELWTLICLAPRHFTSRFYLDDAEDLSWTGLVMFAVGGGVTTSGIFTLQMRRADSHTQKAAPSEEVASGEYGRCRRDDEGLNGSLENGGVAESRRVV